MSIVTSIINFFTPRTTQIELDAAHAEAIYINDMFNWNPRIESLAVHKLKNKMRADGMTMTGSVTTTEPISHYLQEEVRKRQEALGPLTIETEDTRRARAERLIEEKIRINRRLNKADDSIKLATNPWVMPSAVKKKILNEPLLNHTNKPRRVSARMGGRSSGKSSRSHSSRYDFDLLETAFDSVTTSARDDCSSSSSSSDSYSSSDSGSCGGGGE